MQDSLTVTSAVPSHPLEGEVCVQFIRCGKSGCRCQAGHLHGPYHYRVWREGAQVRKAGSTYSRSVTLWSVTRPWV